MKPLIVGGTFDHSGGKSSHLVEQLASAMGWFCINGGTLDLLKNIEVEDVDVLLWMPNVSNKEEKILPVIKERNPKLLLISSKRVIEKEYYESDVVGRLLKSHSNLGIMIEKPSNGYNFKLLDPLGNMHCDTQDITVLAKSLLARVSQIKAMTRISSIRVGDTPEFEIEPAFIERVHTLANEFARHVNAINPYRLLGNASTRCTHGFPAVRDNEGIFVSRRNVQKSGITSRDFVAVRQNLDMVEYYGGHKPSVDTPIQLRLFDHFERVKYMIHGHVYVKDAPMTHGVIPCGYIEELDEIVNIFPDRNQTNFAVNLRGHGCIMFAETPEFFDGLTVVSRPFPERQFG